MSAEAIAQTEPTPTIPEGCVVCRNIIAFAETGEIWGYIAPDGTLLPLGAERTEFRIDSEEKATWLIEKLFDCDIETASLELRRKALLENLDTMLARQRNTKARLLYLFGEQLAEFVRARIAGGKRRFWATPFGFCGFRKKPATVRVRDEYKQEATAWAATHLPEAVKWTPRLSITALKNAKAGLPPMFFERVEERDEFYYRANIENQLALPGMEPGEKEPE